jgi:hypothetical protein
MNVSAKLVKDISGVAKMTRYFRALISRRSAILSIFVVVCACSAAESRAGVIVPWSHESRGQGRVHDEADGLIDFALAGTGSSSSSQVPISEQSEKNGREQASPRHQSIAGLVETNGGASAPVSSSTAQAGSASAALVAVPTVPVAAKSFSYLRERTLQLPQPPLGELLDPPKACA